MSTLSQPFGLRPVRHPTGLVRATVYPGGISTGYASDLFFQAPVIWETSGYLAVAGTTGSILGSFAGVQWTDATGLPRISQNWPALTAGTEITAYVNDAPGTRYYIQANGSVAASAVYDQANLVNPTTGNSITGMSTAAMNSTLRGAGNTGQLRIMGLALLADNDWGDTYTVVEVEIAAHQLVAQVAAV